MTIFLTNVRVMLERVRGNSPAVTQMHFLIQIHNVTMALLYRYIM